MNDKEKRKAALEKARKYNEQKQKRSKKGQYSIEV